MGLTVWRDKLALGIGLWAVSAGVCAGQTASEMPPNPTRVVQLPLSGRGTMAGDVSVTETTNAAASGNSVVTVDTRVTVQPPYSGSAAAGVATKDVMALTLDQALALGLKENLGALAQSAQEQQARGQQGIAKSALLPQVNTVVSEAFEKTNLRTLGVSLSIIPTAVKFNYYDARAARLDQSVFDLVKIRNLKGAGENVQATIKAARNARDLIVLAVAGSYLQLVATRARADATAAEVVSFGAIYQQAADRLEAGLATRVDALRAKVQLQTQEQRLRSLQGDLETQKLKLARIIGLPAGQRFVAADGFRFAALEGVTEDEALRRAAVDRTDLQAAESAMKAAGLAVGAAKAERVPTVAVNADFGAAGVTPTNHSTSVFNVAGVLTIPLYEGGRIKADVEVAAAALRQRTAERDDVRGQIDEDVRQAFIELTTAADQVGVAGDNRGLAHEALVQSTDRFVAGVADTVELVQAEQTVVQADDDYITAVFDHNLGKVALARAMGNAEASLPGLLMKE